MVDPKNSRAILETLQCRKITAVRILVLSYDFTNDVCNVRYVRDSFILEHCSSIIKLELSNLFSSIWDYVNLKRNSSESNVAKSSAP